MKLNMAFPVCECTSIATRVPAAPLQHGDGGEKGRLRRLRRAPWHNRDRVTKADFIYFDAGGGHRAAANALRTTMEQQERPFSIRMVNLQEVLDEIDIYKKVTGVRLQDLYNLMLKKGWTLGSAQWMALMHVVIKLFHSKQVAVLRKFWAQETPELVVSLVPNLNRALRHALPAHIPMVTILTDIAD